MVFPQHRPRRLRKTSAIRQMVQETRLSIKDFVYPLFVTSGRNVKRPVPSMPGVFQYSVDKLLQEAEEILSLGINYILLFGIPTYKDAHATSAYDPEEAIQVAVHKIKQKFPEITVITDVCLCEYTDHGHCGIIEDQEVANDPTLEVLARTALSHCRAGADIVAPSDMMDGRVAFIRQQLDKEAFEHIPIMSYAVKYASAFYGPFRDAAESAPQFGDRRSYQMDPPNIREALKEAELDVAEGADLVIVKPALSYLDVIHQVKKNTQCPVAAYNVSGEYSMVKAASSRGWIDEKKVVLEQLISMKRAGADIIISYYAKEVARWLIHSQ